MWIDVELHAVEGDSVEVIGQRDLLHLNLAPLVLAHPRDDLGAMVFERLLHALHDQPRR